MKKPVEILLFAFIAVLLFAPMAQQCFGIFKIKELKGSFDTIEQPQLTFTNWFGAHYQDSINTYSVENIGFHDLLVRCNNQIGYSLFSEAKANGVVVGKSGFLYETNYIRAISGSDFVGKDTIENTIKKLLFVKEKLKQSNTDIIVVLAPGKASYFPEYIPNAYLTTNSPQTNFDVYKELLGESSLHFIDFHSFFREQKNSSPYPLYPKTGIHWSKYGETLVADSLINYLEQVKGIHVPQLIIDSTILSTEMQDTDDDIEKGMNLLYDIPDFEMAYPKFHFDNTNSSKEIKGLVVADSYYWGLFNMGFSQNCLGGGQFWYYNRQAYTPGIAGSKNVIETDLRSELFNNDVIILLATDANLNRFCFGFIENAYQCLQTGAETFQEKIERYSTRIKNNPTWLDAVAKKATVNHISIDEMIKRDAAYMISLESN